MSTVEADPITIDVTSNHFVDDKEENGCCCAIIQEAFDSIKTFFKLVYEKMCSLLKCCFGSDDKKIVTSENKIAFVIDDRYTKHQTKEGDPERPDRYVTIKKALQDVLTSSNTLKPKKAKEKHILRCHSPSYVELVKKESQQCSNGETKQLSTGDVQVCNQSYDVALLAAGGVIKAVKEIANNKAKTVFCPVRPPGHHSSTDRGAGFCLFNNVAIGAKYALEKFPSLFQRVLIIDWDVHHGDGTEKIVKEMVEEGNQSIFYFSIYEKGIYPSSASKEQKKEKNCVNIPIKGGQNSREAFLCSFKKELYEIAEKVQPQLIFISAGFDAHQKDTISHIDLQDDDFTQLTLLVKEVANKYAQGKIVSVLEGGYNLEVLQHCVINHINALATE